MLKLFTVAMIATLFTNSAFARVTYHMIGASCVRTFESGTQTNVNLSYCQKSLANPKVIIELDPEQAEQALEILNNYGIQAIEVGTEDLELSATLRCFYDPAFCKATGSTVNER
jgi:hypothetical protein